MWKGKYFDSLWKESAKKWDYFCSQNFEATDFESEKSSRRLLTSNAVPSLDISGHQEVTSKKIQENCSNLQLDLVFLFFLEESQSSETYMGADIPSFFSKPQMVISPVMIFPHQEEPKKLRHRQNEVNYKPTTNQCCDFMRYI